MPTSTLGHYERFDPTLVEGGEGADAGVLSVVANNLNHLADQYAQQRVLWAGPSISVTTSSDYELVWQSPPFDLHIWPDGSSYALRVHIRVTSGHVSLATDYKIAIAAPTGVYYTALLAGTSAEETNADVISVVQTGATWETTKMLYLTSAQAYEARQAAVTTDDLTTDVGAGWLRVVVAIFGKEEPGGADGALSGVSVCEYYGL